MGRRSLTRALGIWANGVLVGRWTVGPGGESRFVYDDAWVGSPLGRPLSLSMPLVAGHAYVGDRVRNFFDNLLPDSEPIRRRLAARFGTPSSDPFDLLAAIGRDCVGAVQLLPDGELPGDVHAIEGTPLDEGDVERLLLGLAAPQRLGSPHADDELRISLAGAQEKTALLWHGHRWLRPHGATPTTHILKLPLGLVGHRRADFSTSVENEWLCMNLLAAFGLPVATTAMLRFGDSKVLAVERFDRRPAPDGAWLMRLPQEDFCQVLGVPPHLKYESDGGPGLEAVGRILRGSTDPRRDLDTVLKAQLLFWLLAAPDGHAKNLSIRLLPQGRFELTPLYDVMSIWPVEGGGASQVALHKAKLAMALHGKRKHYAFKAVQRRHFNHTAARCFLRTDAEDLIEEILAAVPQAVASVARRLPEGFPAQVADRIFAGLAASAQALARMPAA